MTSRPNNSSLFTPGWEKETPPEDDRDAVLRWLDEVDTTGQGGLVSEPVNDTEAQQVRQVVSASADQMKMRATKWLYQGRIPDGMITLLAGREGIGKSTIGLDIAARLTRGELPGRYHEDPQNVGIIASEDSWECVILPRLTAARADRRRVFRLEARTVEGRLETISAPEDLLRLAKECERLNITMLVVDPIMSVINGSLDTHKDREVRQALDPLSRFAATTGVAVLGLIHVNKSTTTDPLNSIMASRAFSAVARSVLYCIVDSEADDDDQFLFGHPKCNVGPKQPTISYRILEVRLEVAAEDVVDDDSEIISSRVVWGDDDPRSIRDAMEGPPKNRPTGEVANTLLAWITKEARTVSRGEIVAAFPGVNPSTIDKNLGRMVDRGQIVRPFSAHYKLPDGDA